jgi:hypothetical protein
MSGSLRIKAVRASRELGRSILVIAGVLLLAACTTMPSGATDRDSAMLSQPHLYRGTQYRPHPKGLDTRQIDGDLAPRVAYNGCTAVLTTSLRDADRGAGLDCASVEWIIFEAGVRYGDCVALRRITLAEARQGSGTLCDSDAGQMRASLEELRLRIARR